MRGVKRPLLTYLGEIRSVPYPVHHLLAFRVHGGHVGPHPLPGDPLDGKARAVNVEEDPSVLLLFLPWGPGAVVGRGRGRLLPGAAAEEAVRAGALGPAVSAQLGRGRAGPARGVRSGHRSRGQAVLLQL